MLSTDSMRRGEVCCNTFDLREVVQWQNHDVDRAIWKFNDADFGNHKEGEDLFHQYLESCAIGLVQQRGREYEFGKNTVSQHHSASFSRK